MKKLAALFTLVFSFSLAVADERTYPVSGYVFKKTKGVTANHVTEASGKSAEMQRTYFVCIQRDPRTDTYRDNWLVYRQCWDTTKEVFDAVDVCDWFMVKTEHNERKDGKPSDEKLAKQRQADARKILRFHKCEDK